MYRHANVHVLIHTHVPVQLSYVYPTNELRTDTPGAIPWEDRDLYLRTVRNPFLSFK